MGDNRNADSSNPPKTIRVIRVTYGSHIKNEVHGLIWHADGMGVVAFYKELQRQDKNKVVPDIFIVESKFKRDSNITEQLDGLLTELKIQLDKNVIPDYRCQVAIHFKDEPSSHGHWIALDVQIKDGKPLFLIMDDLGHTGHTKKVEEKITTIFGDGQAIFTFGTENQIQADGESCSRFCLYNLLVTQKIDLISTLPDLKIEKKEGVKRIDYKTLPAKLADLIVPTHRLDDFAKSVPDALKGLLLGAKQEKTLEQKIEAHSSKGKNRNNEFKIHNKYIYHKKSKFEAGVAKLLSKLSDDQIKNILQSYSRFNIVTVSLTDMFKKINDKTIWDEKPPNGVAEMQKIIAEFLKNNEKSEVETSIPDIKKIMSELKNAALINVKSIARYLTMSNEKSELFQTQENHPKLIQAYQLYRAILSLNVNEKSGRLTFNDSVNLFSEKQPQFVKRSQL